MTKFKCAVISIMIAFGAMFASAPVASAATPQSITNSVYSEYQLPVYDDAHGQKLLNGGWNTYTTLKWADVDRFYVAPGYVAISPWGYLYWGGWHNYTGVGNLTLKYIKATVSA